MSGRMNIYFDTEFTGLHKDTSLISIGLVADDGNRFYAELTDYKEEQCDEWIVRNVLSHLILSGNKELETELENDGFTTMMIGNKEQVSEALKEWLGKYSRNLVCFVSDVCHYDMVLLIDLLYKSAINMPPNMCPLCIDVAQKMTHVLGKTEMEAFRISREQFLKDRGIELPKGQKHSSIYDAEVIRLINNCLEIPFT